VSQIFNKFRNFFKNNLFIQVTYILLNKLSKFIKVCKDALPHSSHSNVMYKFKCIDCDASYVDQTSLKSRITEHKNHINRNTYQTSVITEHRISASHEFNWDNINILDEKRELKKRLISEMIFIYKQKHGLNLQNDTKSFNFLYMTLFSKI